MARLIDPAPLAGIERATVDQKAYVRRRGVAFEDGVRRAFPCGQARARPQQDGPPDATYAGVPVRGASRQLAASSYVRALG
jgi:hypothetical protein